ncbi:MAG: hypothetical protein JO108_04490 [Acidobacteriaceae bacterium]|nr:hypothetical protein [Acidobacteriaceae bacterium]
MTRRSGVSGPERAYPDSVFKNSDLRNAFTALCSVTQSRESSPLFPRRNFPSLVEWVKGGTDLIRQAGGMEGYEARFITQTEKYGRQILIL